MLSNETAPRTRINALKQLIRWHARLLCHTGDLACNQQMRGSK